MILLLSTAHSVYLLWQFNFSFVTLVTLLLYFSLWILRLLLEMILRRLATSLLRHSNNSSSYESKLFFQFTTTLSCNASSCSSTNQCVSATANILSRVDNAPNRSSTDTAPLSRNIDNLFMDSKSVRENMAENDNNSLHCYKHYYSNSGNNCYLSGNSSRQFLLSSSKTLQNGLVTSSPTMKTFSLLGKWKLCMCCWLNLSCVHISFSAVWPVFME